MYEERKIVFDWKGFLLKLLIVIIVAFLLFKLFPVKKNVLYDQIYNNNLTTMKDAAKSYYTVERLPKNIGESETLTLQDMLNNKMIVEFVDKNGKYCDTFGSYSTVTKVTDDEYSLKVQLSCGSHIDYIIETIGCYNVCTNNNCEVKLETKKVTEYQYKKATKSTKKVSTCPSGYKLSGNSCYKSDSKITNALISTGESTKIYTDKLVATLLEYDSNAVRTSTSGGYYYCSTGSNNGNGTCSVTGTRTVSVPKVCEKVITGYKSVRTCSTCTVSIQPVYGEKCTGGGTKEETYTYTTSASYVSGSTSYYCASGYKSEGSGSSIKCYKSVTHESCPAGYNKETYGSTFKCYKTISGNNTEYCANANATLKNGKCYESTQNTVNASTSSKNVTNYVYKWSKEPTLAGWTKTGKTRQVEATANDEVNEDSNIANENTNNDIKSSLISDSNSELSQRLSNVNSQNNNKVSVGEIILYVFVGLAFIYLFVMFITSRKYSK